MQFAFLIRGDIVRTSARRLKVRRLFLLGAGASFAASGGGSKSTPLDKDFTAAICALESTSRPKWIASTVRKSVRAWLDHVALSDFPGLEAAIGRQLGHLEFRGAMHPRRLRNATTDSEWLTDIVHLMCRRLSTSTNSGNTYRDFANKVYPVNVGVDEYKDRVVTFNYDTLLDTHLLSRFSAKRVYFDRINDGKAKVPFDNPLLIKLHGSANWRCDSSAFDQLLSANHRAQPFYIDDVSINSAVPSPAENDFPLMVPPIPTKPITNLQLFRFLWTRAYEYLNEAEELVICGYSLPPADRLAVSMFENFANSKLNSISIVDPDPAMISRWRGLIERKGLGRARWTYFVDFRDYVDQMQ